MAKPGSDRDGAMVDKQAGKKVREPSQAKARVAEQRVWSSVAVSCDWPIWLLTSYTQLMKSLICHVGSDQIQVTHSLPKYICQGCLQITNFSSVSVELS